MKVHEIEGYIGIIIVGVGVLFLILLLIYLHLIEGPKEEEEKNNWIKKNGDKLQLQVYLCEVLNLIGNSTPPCIKCDSTELQLWEVRKNDFVLRCLSCKNKFKKESITIRNNTTGNPVEFENFLGQYISFVIFTLNHNDNRLGKYLKSLLKWNFNKLRKGTPLLRGIIVNSNPNYIPTEDNFENIKNDEPSRRIPQNVMDKVWNRDSGKCVKCGSNQKLEFDHIIPFSKGGSNTYRNIQLLCEGCNRSKSNNIG
jgi:hypothetical protein